MHQFCLYLDWAGWKPEVWAAWFQAVMSIVAILAASRLATTTERRAIARRAGVLVEMIKIADKQAFSIKTFFGTIPGEESREAVYAGQSSAFKQYLSALRGLQLESIPDGRMLAAVNNAAVSCEVIIRLLEQKMPANFSDEIRKWSKDLNEAQFVLRESYRQARTVQFSYVHTGPMGQIASFIRQRWVVLRIKWAEMQSH